jgi:hypothetical protein
LCAPGERERRFDVDKIAEFIRRCTLNFRSHDTVLAELRAAHAAS